MPSRCILDLIVANSLENVARYNNVYEDTESYLRPSILFRTNERIPLSPSPLEIATERLNDIRNLNLYQPDGNYNVIDLQNVDVGIVDSPELYDYLEDAYAQINTLNKYGNVSRDDLYYCQPFAGEQNRIESYEDFIAPIKRRLDRNLPLLIDYVDNIIGDETPLGEIARQQISNTVLTNLEDNIFQETVGRINTDVFGLLAGERFIREDFTITIPRTPIGQGAQIAQKLLGLQLPFCYIPDEAFGINSYSDITSEQRLKILLSFTGKAYKKIILNNFQKNEYYPEVEDELIGNYYYLTDTKSFNGVQITFGGVNLYRDFNGNHISMIAKDKNNLNPNIIGRQFPPQENEDEFSDEWSNKTQNRFNSKSLLYKTKQLFFEKSDVTFVDSYTKSFVLSDGLEDVEISRGSSITSFGNFVTDDNVEITENDYFRVFTKGRKYGKLSTTLRHRGLDNGDTRSVLAPNGMPFIAPTIRDQTNEVFKNFMFSISNFAWKGNSADIPLCEKYISPDNTVARRMWFAPYDIKFSESSSQSIEETVFFGRPEPIYTTSNTKRTASLSFAILVDHPEITNEIRGEYTHIWERYFRGDKSVEENIDALIKSRLSPKEQENINNLKKTFKKKEIVINDKIKSDSDNTTIDDFGTLVSTFYFPNEVTDIVPSNPQLVTLNGGYENGDGVGLGYTYLNGTQRLTIKYIDRNDIGLNSFFNDDNLKSVFNKIQEGLILGSDKITVYLVGYASSAISDRISNFSLSLVRAANMSQYVQTNIEVYDLDGILNFYEGEIEYKTIARSDEADGITTEQSFGDEFNAKLNRRVEIYVKFDENFPDGNQKIDDKIVDPNFVPNIPNNVEPIIDQIDEKISQRLFFDKCQFFKYLEINDPNMFNTISQKIDYFNPAYHSYTPQNFNERLTFLQQCVRSSNNIGIDDEEQTNFFYGHQPVVYLSLGDWFRTKAFIRTLTIDYNAYDLVWDFNPESGVGVQPMLANISLDLEIIGGQSMSGALNRLQNALSFNYYANTEMYDLRSDSLSLNVADKNVSVNIIDGVKISDFIKNNEIQDLNRNLALIRDQGSFLDNQVNFDGSNLEISTLDSNNSNDLLALKQLLKL